MKSFFLEMFSLVRNNLCSGSGNGFSFTIALFFTITATFVEKMFEFFLSLILIRLSRLSYRDRDLRESNLNSNISISGLFRKKERILRFKNGKNLKIYS